MTDMQCYYRIYYSDRKKEIEIQGEKQKYLLLVDISFCHPVLILAGRKVIGDVCIATIGLWILINYCLFAAGKFLRLIP